jgi:hypothetical protein
MKKFIGILIAIMYSIFMGIFLIGEIFNGNKYE